MPFGGLLAGVADHNRFLGCVLDGDWAEIDFVWEVQKGAATDSPNGYYEFFTLCNDRQVVSVIDLGLWAEPDRILDLHTWSYAAAHDIHIRSSLSSGGFEFFDR